MVAGDTVSSPKNSKLISNLHLCDYIVNSSGAQKKYSPSWRSIRDFITSEIENCLAFKQF